MSRHADAARLSLALRAAQAGAWEAWPLEGRFEADEAAGTLCGVCPGSRSIAEVLEAVHPDDRPSLEQQLHAVAATRSPFYSEHRTRQSDGSYRWICAQADVHLEPELRLVGLVQDITRRKGDEEALQTRTRHMELLARISRKLILSDPATDTLLADVFGDAAALVGAQMYFNYRPHDAVSMRLCTWGGLTADERGQFEIMRYGELLCGRVAARRRRIIVNDIEHSGIEGSEAVRAAGYGAYAGFPLLAEGSLLGTIAFITRTKTAFSDEEITLLQAVCDQVSATLERRRLAEELREKHLRLSKVLATEAVGVLFWDFGTGHLIDANDAFLKMMGYSRADLVAGLTWRTFTPEAYVAGSQAALEELRQTGRLGPYEKEYIRKDGSRLWMLFTGSVLSEDQCVEFAIDVSARKLMEDQAQSAAEKLEQTLSTAATGLTRLDAQMRYVSANPAYCRIAGLAPEQIVGRTMEEVLGAAAMPKVKPFVDKVLSGETVEYEAEVFWKHAAPGWIHAVYTPWRNASGAVTGWVGSVTDITARKRAEAALAASEERLRLSLEVAKAVAFDWNIATGQVIWTDGIVPLLGLNPEQEPPSYRTWHKHLHPADVGAVEQAIGKALNGTAPYLAEYRVITGAGEERWISAHGRIVRDGASTRMVGAMVDITERKLAEIAISVADRQKDEFLAMLAHELRNPLSVISSATEILTRSAKDGSGQKVLGMLRRQTQQLTKLVDDLLDISRIARGRITLHVKPLEIGVVIEHAVESVEPLIGQKSHQLTVHRAPGPLYVSGDLHRLVQAVSNVLGNAAKYTANGGRLDLTVSEQDSQVVIEIRDNGMGLAPELLPRVFDLFVQSERTLDRSQGGLGIGLAVVKRLIEKHGGSVSAASDGLGQGACFTLRLPVISAPGGTEERWAGQAVARRRVLVVDDNVDAADGLKMLLELEHHQVWTAYGGEEAIEMADQHHPDVIFLDIGLPGMDGYEVARRVRSSPSGKLAVLIALTGYGQSEDRRRSEAAGFNLHLVKPITPETLNSALAAET